jgi:hypothetical protein
MSSNPATQVIPLESRNEIGNVFSRLGKTRAAEGEYLSAQEIGLKAGMNYEVQKFQLGAMVMDVDAEGVETLRSVLATPSYGLFSNRNGDWQYLNTVKRGASYEVVQNMDIARILDTGDGETVVPLSKLFRMYSAGVIGRYTYFCMEMGRDTVKLGTNKYDEHITYAVVGNDFNTFQTFWSIGTTAVICLNTLMANLAQSAQDETIWRISHRSQPMAILKYRAELERGLQSARGGIYAEFENWAKTDWTLEDKDAFVYSVFPDPPKPVKMKRADVVRANPGIDPDLEKPLLEMGNTAKNTYDDGMERAERNRKGLNERIGYWQDKLELDSLYTGYAAGTDIISWRHERGSYEDLAERVVFNTGRQEMDRMVTALRDITDGTLVDKVAALRN